MHQRHRLRHRRDIAALREKGQSRRHPMAVLLYQANEETISRFAFSASQHVGRAVARNRAKRLLRESVRLHMAEIRPGWDCMFIARRPAATASYREVEAAVLQLLGRARLLQEEVPATSSVAGEEPAA